MLLRNRTMFNVTNYNTRVHTIDSQIHIYFVFLEILQCATVLECTAVFCEIQTTVVDLCDSTKMSFYFQVKHASKYDQTNVQDISNIR